MSIPLWLAITVLSSAAAFAAGFSVGRWQWSRAAFPGRKF